MLLYMPRVNRPVRLEHSSWMRASVANPSPTRMSNRPRRRIRVHGPSLRVAIQAATTTIGRAPINFAGRLTLDPITIHLVERLATSSPDRRETHSLADATQQTQLQPGRGAVPPGSPAPGLPTRWPGRYAPRPFRLRRR